VIEQAFVPEIIEETGACSWCEEDFETEELSKDADGDPICSECYCDNFHFTCCRCRSCGAVEDQHNYVVVFDPTEHEVPRGVYRVIAAPYYCQPITGGGWLFSHALERVADVSVDMSGEDYPVGHLCIECQRVVIEAAVLHDWEHGGAAVG